MAILNKQHMAAIDTDDVHTERNKVLKGKEIKHLGTIAQACEIVGHSWEYKAGIRAQEVNMFGLKRKINDFPDKLMAVVHFLDIDGRRKSIRINDLSVEVHDPKKISKTAKNEAVNLGRRVFKIGESVPVKYDVWEDGYFTPAFDRREFIKQNPDIAEKLKAKK